jgi:hypothetical protein
VNGVLGFKRHVRLEQAFNAPNPRQPQYGRNLLVG